MFRRQPEWFYARPRRGETSPLMEATSKAYLSCDELELVVPVLPLLNGQHGERGWREPFALISS
jgi:hypothetical protein